MVFISLGFLRIPARSAASQQRILQSFSRFRYSSHFRTRNPRHLLQFGSVTIPRLQESVKRDRQHRCLSSMASTSLPETNESPRIQHSVEEGLWRREAEKEQARMLELLGGEMRSKNGKSRHHPIYNFIFEYYMFKPKMLLQYSPGLGVRLEGAQPGDPALSSRGFSHDSWGAWADPSLAKNKTVESLRWTRDLLKTTVDRKPELHCYGLHEWAMLYHPAESKEKPPHKYQSIPLRVSQETVNSVIDREGGIRCTHFDAFRFFTKDASPKNNVQLSREQQQAYEQPGCLHANMDLFKWTIKLSPWVPSSMLQDTLRLAIQARVLDMRASPYDVEGMGEGFDLSPIAIETLEGRAEYKRLQAELWKQAGPIRERLVEYYDEFLRHHARFQKLT
ncbi:hypothetical protein AAMO2058_001565600 [Amorphochlora amoebiformis]